MGKNGDLSDSEHGMVFGARWAGLRLSETADLHLHDLQRVFQKEKKYCIYISSLGGGWMKSEVNDQTN